ncbi:MAG: sigma-70 family RNA polymerase sigma factor [Clostridia bacterium]|nr:sigma-70 family RNA polymerase sigma factor [Clostridia bacterium]
MSNTAESKESLINEFAESYMEKLFYFCLKKTGSNVEAEDLTQDIALNIIIALNGGTVPTNFSAWVWQIARNRYALWADRKHKQRKTIISVDIRDYEIEDERENSIDKMIRSEQLSLLRRELAFIKSDYRDIVVAYYIDNKSLRDISTNLSVSFETVKKRLYRARKILKEGMDMAREFGKRSYNPEQIAFVMNGRDGKNGQPWSIITHLLYKNIFLETYENPQNAEELSLELGIALPYMEDELEFLVQEQLLIKEGNKYQTNFHIVSRDQQKEIFDANKRIQKPLTEKICAFVDAYAKENAKINVDFVGYETAKWALLIRMFDWLKYVCKKRMGSEDKEAHPERPDGGAWTLTGYETIDWQKPYFVGQHGCMSHDESEVKFFINFGQYKFYYKNIQAKSPEHLSWNEGHTLWLVCNGKIEECNREYLNKLLEYGYLKLEKGTFSPNVVVIESDETLTAELDAMADEIYDLITQAPDIERGYIVEQALENGWLTYNDDMIDTIGAYICI